MVLMGLMVSMDSIEVDLMVKQGIRVRLVTLGAQLYKIIQAEDELRKGDLDNCITRCSKTLDDITSLLSKSHIELEEMGTINTLLSSLGAISDNEGYKNSGLDQNLYSSPELKGAITQNIDKAYSSYKRMKQLL